MSGPQQIILAASGGAVQPSFTFSNAKLLLHGSARPFVDSSLGKRPVVNHQARCTLGSGKINHPNLTAALIVRGSDTDWQFGTGSWFISARVTHSGASGARIFDTRPVAGSGSGWAMSSQAGTLAPFMNIEGTTYGVGTPAANLVLTSNVESTVSFSYDGTDLRCFVDGTLSWTHTVALNIDTGGFLCIGSSVSGNVPNNDADVTQLTRSVLIVKGESVAVASFFAPTTWTDTGIVIESWNPATYSNVKLNCHMSGSNGGTTFTDTSTGAKTITVNGNAQTSTAQAQIGSSSGLFDGTDDYLTVPDSADWDFGTGDFSIEMWVRTANNANRQVLISNYLNSTTGWTLQISTTTAGRLHLGLTGDGAEYDSTVNYLPMTTTTWRHVAASRVSGILLIFVGGECVFAVPDTQNITGSSQPLYIGRLTTALTTIDFNGHMQELRVINGEGYPRSFIVQTAAHPDS